MRHILILAVIIMLAWPAWAQDDDDDAGSLYRQIVAADAEGDRHSAWRFAREYLDRWPDRSETEEICYNLPSWAETWEQFQEANELYLGRYPHRAEATLALVGIVQGLAARNRYNELVLWLEPYAAKVDFSFRALSALSTVELDRQLQVQLWYARGLAATSRYGLAKDALDELMKIKQYLPSLWRMRPELGDEVLILQANCAMKTSQFQPAQQLFDQLLRDNPNSQRGASAWWGYATCAGALQQQAAWRAALERIVTHYPGTPEAFMARYTLSHQAAEAP